MGRTVEGARAVRGLWGVGTWEVGWQEGGWVGRTVEGARAGRGLWEVGSGEADRVGRRAGEAREVWGCWAGVRSVMG